MKVTCTTCKRKLHVSGPSVRACWERVKELGWRHLKGREPQCPECQPHAAGWKTVRYATLRRDGHQCRKCAASTGLEVHHIKARVYGGRDELDNLITLCSLCHDEWTHTEPPAEVMTFETWLGIPPARLLAAIFARPWPENVTAADYQRQVVEVVRLARSAFDRDTRNRG